MSVCGTTLDCRSTDVQADVTNCWTAPRHLGDERGRCNVPRLGSPSPGGDCVRRGPWTVLTNAVTIRSHPTNKSSGAHRRADAVEGATPGREEPRSRPSRPTEDAAEGAASPRRGADGWEEAARPFSCRLPVDHRRARREGHVHPFARDVTPVGAQIHEYAVPRCPVPWRQGQVQRAGSVWRCPMGVRRGGHREAHGWRHHRSYD